MNEHEFKSIIIWEEYLIYSIALGIAKASISDLQKLYKIDYKKWRDSNYD